MKGCGADDVARDDSVGGQIIRRNSIVIHCQRRHNSFASGNKGRDDVGRTDSTFDPGPGNGNRGSDPAGRSREIKF